MSGHSKWSNIKHRKGKQDAIKGKIYTKISKAIMVAVKEGGGDPNFNPRLYDAIQKGKDNNMPNENIERAIKKGLGATDGKGYEELTYEGYGPGGVAVIVDVLTDNRNRTAGDVRHFFDKYGGSLGETGCVNWMFERKGLILIENKDDISEDDVMMAALEAGGDDVELSDDGYEISVMETAKFNEVKKSLEEQGFTILNAMVSNFPKNTVELDEEKGAKMTKLLDMLEEHDDVQDIYHNWDMPDEEEE